MSAGVSQAKRIVYLLGAGATHAELGVARPDYMTESSFLDQNSLLLAEVSKRVCYEARRRRKFPANIDKRMSPHGLSNIELFISLLEENRVETAPRMIKRLKAGIQSDIEDRLKKFGKGFYLHKALLEFHKVEEREHLTGVISLNYDGVLDDAYRHIFGREPNYGLTGDNDESVLPILKLHGGFGMRYRQKRLSIITPGVRKNYLELPYSFVWGRALELLVDCDVLRVIGCSLSSNDIGVIDLLFKAHSHRREPFAVQVIDFDPPRNRIQEQFGFLPRLERATKIEGNLIADDAIYDPWKGGNPFKIWLKAKIQRMLDFQTVRRSQFLRKVVA